MLKLKTLYVIAEYAYTSVKCWEKNKFGPR